MANRRLLCLVAVVLLLTAAVFAQMGTIEGTVLLPNEGGPAAGALVTLHRWGHDSLNTATDSVGHFRYDSLAVGEWGVHAYLDPYVPAFGEVHVMENQTAHITLHLHNVPTGIGRVEGIILLPHEGGPATGAAVVLFRGPGDSLSTGSDDSGHFAFDSAAVGEHDIHATLSGYRIVYGEVHVMDGETVHVTLVLRDLLTGIGRVEGVVFLPEEAGPASGATVWLFRAHGDSIVTTANDSGQFVFDSARVGEHDIHASLTGYRDAHEEVEVGEGQTTHINLHLRAEPTGGGTVNGFVVLSDASPVNHASVMLEGQGEHHGENEDYHVYSDSTGYFFFEHVPGGSYEIEATAFMHGSVEQDIAVVDSQTTEVMLVLNDSSNGEGHHHGDTLTTVDLVGVALVVHPDSIEHPNRVCYYIDVDGDGVANYRLSFGPSWYDPGNGAQRPTDGDSISVHGGLLTYTDPPVVVVYEINGMFWREPFHGHGGHGGGDHHHEGCEPDSVTVVELAGTAVVHEGEGFHGDNVSYALDTDQNGAINYRLDFGRSDYDPGNGAQRPSNGDSVAIVGGQVYCPGEEIPVVIVYEINGLFWREPGDTLGLGPDSPNAVGPVNTGFPLTYLTARNYPNPFNPITTIQYSIPVAGNVKLTVYDLEGREVATLFEGRQDAGSYAVSWDGTRSASGIYFYRLTSGEKTFTDRMLLLK